MGAHLPRPRRSSRSSRRQSALVIALFLAAIACNGGGGEFLGKWVNLKNQNDTMTITRNGDQFLVESGGNKVGAVYKDGALEVASVLGAIRLTYVRKTETLTVPGFFGLDEYAKQDSKAASQAAAERKQQQELAQQREAMQRKQQQNEAAARQAQYERERAEREQLEETKKLYSIGYEAIKRNAYDDGLPPVTKAADRGYAPAQNYLAWLYATSQDQHLLDPSKAVRYASAAVKQEPENWEYADTLAAAYARAGDFKRAIEIQQRAIDLLRENYRLSADDRERSLEETKDRLAQYNRRQPFSQ